MHIQSSAKKKKGIVFHDRIDNFIRHPWRNTRETPLYLRYIMTFTCPLRVSARLCSWSQKSKKKHKCVQFRYRKRLMSYMYHTTHEILYPSQKQFKKIVLTVEKHAGSKCATRLEVLQRCMVQHVLDNSRRSVAVPLLQSIEERFCRTRALAVPGAHRLRVSRHPESLHL